MLGPAKLTLLLADNFLARRQRLVNDIEEILGMAPVAGFLPTPADGLTSLDPWSGFTWTAEATMQGRLTALGNGLALAFNGTSNFLTSPSRALVNFGTALLDSPVTMVAVANVTSTVTFKDMATKFNNTNGNREYIFRVDTADKLALIVYDNSLAVNSSVTSTPTVVGSWAVLAATYNGVGGALAAEGMTLYKNGASIASTPADGVGYVAMEPLAAPLDIGAAIAGTANFFSGSLACLLAIPVNSSAATLLSLKTRLSTHFRLGL